MRGPSGAHRGRVCYPPVSPPRLRAGTVFLSPPQPRPRAHPTATRGDSQAAVPATEATPQAGTGGGPRRRRLPAGVADLDQHPPVVVGVTIDPIGTIALLLHDTAPDRLPVGGHATPPTTPAKSSSPPPPSHKRTRGHQVGLFGSTLPAVGIGVRSQRRLLLQSTPPAVSSSTGLTT